MLLAFDIGNTNIVLGAYRDGVLTHNWRMETYNSRSADEYGMVINQLFAYEGLLTSDVDDVIISTVVPSVLYTIQHMSAKYFGRRAMVVGPGIKTGLAIKYDSPEQVGADRIVNAVAALSKYGGPLVIVDLGTATTFCAVTGNSEYLGGSIAPGIKISSEALFEKTAKLPRVEIEEPGKTICTNTNESMQSGLVYGHMGLIEHMVGRMKTELASRTGCSADKIKVIATGGMAEMMARGISCIDTVDRLLTLDGLSIIYHKNKDIGPSRLVPKSERETMLPLPQQG